MALTGVTAGAGYLAVRGTQTDAAAPEPGPAGKSAVAVLKAASYDDDLVAIAAYVASRPPTRSAAPATQVAEQTAAR